VDAFAKGFKENTDAITVINGQTEKIDNWINKASPKLGIKYEH